MAECFWTDLVGVTQGPCGAPEGLFAVGTVIYTDWGAPDGFRLAPPYAYACEDITSEPPAPFFTGLLFADIIGAEVYLWPNPNESCGMDYKAKLACGADVFADWGENYIVGPADPPYNPQRLGEVAYSYTLTPFGGGAFGFPSGYAFEDLRLLVATKWPADFPGPGVFKFTVRTNLGDYDWWMFVSDCY